MQLSLLWLHYSHAGMTKYLQYKTLVSQFPFPLSVGEDMLGGCDSGPWWPLPTAALSPAFICTDKAFRNYFIRSVSNEELTAVQ